MVLTQGQPNGWLFFQYASRRTVDVTNNQTRWDKYHNDVRLEERMIEIEKWRNELERILANTDREIGLLSDFKDNCDHALAQKAIPESVNAECLGKTKSFWSECIYFLKEKLRYITFVNILIQSIYLIFLLLIRRTRSAGGDMS